jgi:hypothetical protein
LDKLGACIGEKLCHLDRKLEKERPFRGSWLMVDEAIQYDYVLRWICPSSSVMNTLTS